MSHKQWRDRPGRGEASNGLCHDLGIGLGWVGCVGCLYKS
jgi:hypothetical protein